MQRLNRISCHECRNHLDAYLHNELSRGARCRVDQHLGECADCRTVYVAQRDLSADIAASFRQSARPDSAQLSRIWLAIQNDMNHPTPVGARLDMRYGLAAFVLALALLLPWSLDTPPVARALPLPPQPALEAQTGTPARTSSAAQTVAMRVTDPAIPPAETPVAPPDDLNIP